jgi:hypothetical protein
LGEDFFDGAGEGLGAAGMDFEGLGEGFDAVAGAGGGVAGGGWGCEDLGDCSE